MVYLITYDLNKPRQNYAGLYEAIKELGAWWHYLDSTWIVDTSLNSSQIYDRIHPTMDSNDYLLIIRVTRDYKGWLKQEAWDWLNSHL